MIRMSATVLKIACGFPWKRGAFAALLISVSSFAYPSDRDPSMVPYQSAAAVHSLSIEQAQFGNPAILRGVVTQTTPEGLTLQDGTTGIWIYTHESSRFTPGDLIEVVGTAGPGLFAPVVRASAIRTLGRRSLPKPRAVSFRQLSTGDQDDQFVSVTGVVLSVGVHPGASASHEMSLRIGLQDGELDAVVSKTTAAETRQLVGAVVRIDAVELCTKNGSRQIIAPALSVPSMHNITILRPRPADLFATPIVPISRIMQFRSGTSYFDRVRIRGTVTYYEPGNSLVVEDASGAILVRTSQVTDIHIGDQIDAIGFPTPNNSGPFLSDANFNDLGRGSPLKPLVTTIGNMSTGAARYKLVSVVGHLVRRADEPSRTIFILQDKTSLLLAELPRSIFYDAVRRVEEGSTIRISGISMVNVEGPWNYGTAIVQSTLLVRSLDDIQVISPPTWWTTTHVVYIAFVLALLTLASLVLLAFSRVERSKLQGVLEERERLALEIHDTVIQGCVGVSSLLEAALGIDSSHDSLQDQLLNYASEQARTTIESAREAVWALRNASAPTIDVPVICEQLSRQFRMNFGAPVSCSVTGMPFTLSESATRELMMAVKEALANAATHAKPKSINIDVRFTNRDLKISISDDGCGFDPSTDLSNNGHYGILGMRKRVRLLRGSLSIESKPHQGTKVQITVPRRWRTLERIWFGNASESVGTD